jgi:drug/metabolite transporter (DMT)-like permease
VTPARRSIMFMAGFAILWTVLEMVGGRLRASYSPYQVVWSRYGVHLALMFVLVGWRDPRALLQTRRPVFQMLRSMMMLVMPASFITALRLGLDVGTIMAVFCLSPLLILLLAAAFLKERAASSTWLAALAVSLGGMLLAQPGLLEPTPLLLLPLAMAASFSVYVVMTRALKGESLIANLVYTGLGVFVALTAMMPRVWVAPGLHDTVVLIAVGALGLAALWSLDRMTSVPVSVAAPFVALQMVSSTWIAVTLRTQPVDLSLIIGTISICGAGIYTWLRAAAPMGEGA